LGSDTETAVLLSAYDEMSHRFQCVSPECKKPFERLLRNLRSVKEVACPYCGTKIDIRNSKAVGEIGNAFETANQIDLQRREAAAKVTVYPVDVFDVVEGRKLRSRRMATRKGAATMRGEIVEADAIEISKSELERGEEWTPLDFVPPQRR
jgi:hypothetical protein